MYEGNCWEGNDVSILKTIYADYHIKKSDNNMLNLGTFLDKYIKNNTSTSIRDLFSIFYPFKSWSHITGNKRISKLINLHRTETEALLSKENAPHKVFEDFVYGTNIMQITPILSKEDKLARTKEYIFNSYNSGHKHIGVRAFGYLLKSGVLGVINPSEYIKEWEKFVGKGIKPSDSRLLANPTYNRSTIPNKNKTIINNLKKIHDFFRSLQFDEVAECVEKDIKNLEELDRKNQKAQSDIIAELAKLASKK